MSLTLPTPDSPPLQPPLARPLRSGRAGAAISRLPLPLPRIHRRHPERVMALMTQVSAAGDIHSVLTAAAEAVVDLLAPRRASPVIARVYRIERDMLVLAGEHGAATRSTPGASIPLGADPLIMAAVTGDHTLAEAGPRPHRIACPVHAGASARALLLVERRGRDFRRSEIQVVDGVGGIATLAITNLVRARSVAHPEAEPLDPLTGLPGRATFEARVQAARQAFAIIAVDVDHLGHLNATLGREAGDEALRSTARAVLASLRESDLVCRTGDDELSILTIGSATAVVGSVAERVRSQVAELAGGARPVRVSVGWAVGAAGEAPDQVWARADEALGRAKTEGRNRVAGSITGHPASTPGRGWTTLLSRTLASQQVSPVYQPIVSLPDGRIVAYEGLARPAHLDGADSVDELFSTAQRLGVVNELDWICRRAVVRGAEGLSDDATLYLNIDLSAVSDVDEDAEQMVSLLRWVGRAPRAVVLEVVDADRFTNLGQLGARIDLYRRAGFRIAIDDTGRDGIGLDILNAVRPDVIKIDESVVNHADGGEARRIILECVALGEQIGADVVAEGVERLVVAAQMTQMGVGLAQGFLFGRPESIEAPHRDLEGGALRAALFSPAG